MYHRQRETSFQVLVLGALVLSLLEMVWLFLLLLLAFCTLLAGNDLLARGFWLPLTSFTRFPFFPSPRWEGEALVWSIWSCPAPGKGEEGRPLERG